MKPNITDGEAGRQVDSQSRELIAEFRSHCEEVQKQYPEHGDTRVIFESWAIQKIAGLQLSVFQLNERIPELENSQSAPASALDTNGSGA
jgi:hypothetical protein